MILELSFDNQSFNHTKVYFQNGINVMCFCKFTEQEDKVFFNRSVIKLPK